MTKIITLALLAIFLAAWVAKKIFIRGWQKEWILEGISQNAHLEIAQIDKNWDSLGFDFIPPKPSEKIIKKILQQLQKKGAIWQDKQSDTRYISNKMLAKNVV